MSNFQPPHMRTLMPSNMEEDVVDIIISFLPIKEAKKFSILSTRFKNSWKYCRDLSFDSDFAQNLSNNEFILVVTNILNEHLSPFVDTFKLYFNPTGHIILMAQWIKRVIHLGVKEIELDFSPSGRLVILSYDLINVDSLKTLKLVSCELYLPFAANGLRYLRDVTFEHVRGGPISIQAVFINCLFLRSLQLINCSQVNDLKIPIQASMAFQKLVVKNCSEVKSMTINAPNLRTLHYIGKICGIIFKSDFPGLEDVILEIEHPKGFQILSDRQDMMNRFAHVGSLRVSSVFLEVLSPRFENGEYREMEFLLWNLREFHLVVAKESFINPCDVFIFLKKCQRIEKVFIDLEDNAFGNSVYWEFHGRKHISEYQALFPFLNTVKIKGFTLNEMPVTMARFFLNSAVLLRSLVLVKAKNYIFPPEFTPDCIKRGIWSRANIEIL